MEYVVLAVQFVFELFRTAWAAVLGFLTAPIFLGSLVLVVVVLAVMAGQYFSASERDS
jgi:hypothetical protein